MTDSIFATLVALRAVVGYLGERAQFGWWQSSFFAPASNTFLTPLFPRTQVLARCNGVTHAAALVHDARIGVGDVYHLFRLPEDFEQTIHRKSQEKDLGVEILSLVADQDTALAYLRHVAAEPSANAVGPTWIGASSALRNDRNWQQVAGYYAQAFSRQIEIFPYFADRGT